ncbi:MAG TPA: malto-oligosyltrehalose trehalohydrolase [Vicinamibacterales bacterium]
MAAHFGAVPTQGGVRFTVWASKADHVQLVLHDGAAAGTHTLAPGAGGVFETWIDKASAGDRYSYILDGSKPLPDPASRFQPDGVHGPSQIVDPTLFRWTDRGWQSRPVRDLVLYELHTGTFSPEGTFNGIRERLPYLRDLGITAIELMPVADFAGDRSWGYDGVALYAPSRAYGSPDDLRGLVDAAHAHGLSVILDVVYNHLGPEGAYLPAFTNEYFTNRHQTPWGASVNLDGPGSRNVRRFILDNACYWIREYHLDGLRLDATHALIDDSPRHIIQEIVEAVRAEAGRHIIVHAEDDRNMALMVEDVAAGGWGLDGVWADDFHHVLRVMTAGDTHGYYQDFAGHTRELATCLEDGWLYSGGHSEYMKHPRGTSAARIPMQRFVVCIQNHDQIGNRAMGERLHHTVSPEVWRAMSVVLLTAPMTPLLFMGQEWAASTPFQYFTDLEPELGRAVCEGRRSEFKAFPEFASPAASGRIPDPQAESTFASSRLRWDERSRGEHARTLALYRSLLVLRREHAALAGSDQPRGTAVSPDDESIVVRRSENGETFWVVARFKTGGTVDLGDAAATMRAGALSEDLEITLDTEHGEFTADPQAIDVDGPVIRFARAGAVILKER